MCRGWVRRRLPGTGELERRLSAELHNNPHQFTDRGLHRDQLQDVFGGQRLEIKPVGRVVIGRDGLGVAVDHDRLDAEVRQREGGVATTVVELDPLPDAIGATAQDDRLSPRGRIGLALRRPAQSAGLIGRIHVRRDGCELGRAAVDTFEHGTDAQRVPGVADVFLSLMGQGGETGIGETHRLEAMQGGRIGGNAVILDVRLFLNDGLDLAQEPGIVGTGSVDFLDAEAMTERLGYDTQTVRGGLPERANGGSAPVLTAVRTFDGDLVQSAQAGFEAAQGPSEGSRQKCGQWPSLRPLISSGC